MIKGYVFDRYVYDTVTVFEILCSTKIFRQCVENISISNIVYQNIEETTFGQKVHAIMFFGNSWHFLKEHLLSVSKNVLYANWSHPKMGFVRVLWLK